METLSTGLLLAARFSRGCNRANELGITPFLKKYVESRGENCSEREIRKKLEDLFSYLYYRVIAESNNIKDPFDVRVVKAYWIGNELLENIEASAVKRDLLEEKEHYDKVILGIVMRPLLETKRAHHNIYARDNPKCSVTSDGKYFYHLGEKRMEATTKDIKNLSKYGKI